MIDAMITNSATTFTIGSWSGRESRRSRSAASAGPRGEDRDDDLVERQRERQQAARESAVRICGNITKRNVCQ